MTLNAGGYLRIAVFFIPNKSTAGLVALFSINPRKNAKIFALLFFALRVPIISSSCSFFNHPLDISQNIKK
jgi:hypothetical protein